MYGRCEIWIWDVPKCEGERTGQIQEVNAFSGFVLTLQKLTILRQPCLRTWGLGAWRGVTMWAHQTLAEARRSSVWTNDDVSSTQ